MRAARVARALVGVAGRNARADRLVRQGRRPGGRVLAVLAGGRDPAVARRVPEAESHDHGAHGAARLAAGPREDHGGDGLRQRAGPVRAGVHVDAAHTRFRGARRLERGRGGPQAAAPRLADLFRRRRRLRRAVGARHARAVLQPHVVRGGGARFHEAACHVGRVARRGDAHQRAGEGHPRLRRPGRGALRAVQEVHAVRVEQRGHDPVRGSRPFHVRLSAEPRGAGVLREARQSGDRRPPGRAGP